MRKRKLKKPSLINLLALILAALAILILSACELITPKPEAPTIHALVISLDYKNTSVTDLDGTIRDAKELNAALQTLGSRMGTNVQETLMLQEGTALLYNDPLYPTKTHILDTLAAFAADEDIKPTDIFMLYYSGHGIGSAFDTEDPDRGNLVTARPDNTTAYQTISIQEIKDALQAIDATKLLMVDACYSGHFVTEYPLTNQMRVVLGSGYDPNLYYLTAASDVQLSYESDLDGYGNHGYFTYFLLEALGWDHTLGSEIVTSGIITQVGGAIPEEGAIPVLKNSKIQVTDIYNYIRDSIKDKLNILFRQTPQTGKGPMDLILFDSTWK
jgi:hypothetical protein